MTKVNSTGAYGTTTDVVVLPRRTRTYSEVFDEGFAAGMSGECGHSPHAAGTAEHLWWTLGSEAGHHQYCSILEYIVATFPQD